MLKKFVNILLYNPSLKGRHKMSKRGFSQGLRRNQIDRTISGLKKVPLSRPQDGWVKTVREILGMTQRQLAERMSVAPPTLSRLEKAEIDGSTTIKSLDRAASALHCRLVYFLVPENASFEELLHQKAQEAAKRAVELASASMHLEGQGIDPELQNTHISQLAEELVRTADKRIWELPK